ncbi:hypothetical protein LG3211_0039 [Lysobacter gummosus]|nr:hypothetical protein LG3211_0039 [Lysobacter gummosus]
MRCGATPQVATDAVGHSCIPRRRKAPAITASNYSNAESGERRSPTAGRPGLLRLCGRLGGVQETSHGIVSI